MKLGVGIPLDFVDFSFELDSSDDGLADNWENRTAARSPVTIALNTPGFRSRFRQRTLCDTTSAGIIRVFETNTLAGKFLRFNLFSISSGSATGLMTCTINNGGLSGTDTMPDDLTQFSLLSVKFVVAIQAGVSSFSIDVSQFGAGAGVDMQFDQLAIEHDFFDIEGGVAHNGSIPKPTNPLQIFRLSDFSLKAFDSAQGAEKYRIPLEFNNINTPDFDNLKALWENTRATYSTRQRPVVFQRETDLPDNIPELLVCHWTDSVFDVEELGWIGSGKYNVRMTLEEI